MIACNDSDSFNRMYDLDDDDDDDDDIDDLITAADLITDPDHIIIDDDDDDDDDAVVTVDPDHIIVDISSTSSECIVTDSNSYAIYNAHHHHHHRDGNNNNHNNGIYYEDIDHHIGCYEVDQDDGIGDDDEEVEVILSLSEQKQGKDNVDDTATVHHQPPSSRECVSKSTSTSSNSNMVRWNDIHGIISLVSSGDIGSSSQKENNDNDNDNGGGSTSTSSSATIGRGMVPYDDNRRIIVSSSSALSSNRGMVACDDDDDDEGKEVVRGMVPMYDDNDNNARGMVVIPASMSYDDGQDHYPAEPSQSSHTRSSSVTIIEADNDDDYKYWNDNDDDNDDTNENENGNGNGNEGDQQWKVWSPLPANFKSPNFKSPNANINANINTILPTAITPSMISPNNNNINNNNNTTRVDDKHQKKKKKSISNNKNKNKNCIGVIVKRSSLNNNNNNNKSKSRTKSAISQVNKINSNNNSNSKISTSSSSSSKENNNNNNNNNNNSIGVIVKRSNLNKDRQRNIRNHNNNSTVTTATANVTATSGSNNSSSIVSLDGNNIVNSSSNNNTTTTPTNNISPGSIYTSNNFDLDSDEDDDTDDVLLLDDDINDNIDDSRYTRSIHSMPVLEEVTEEESPMHGSSVTSNSNSNSNSNNNGNGKQFSPSSSSPSSLTEIVPTTPTSWIESLRQASPDASKEGSVGSCNNNNNINININNSFNDGGGDDERFFHQSQHHEQVAVLARSLLCVETVSTRSQSENGYGDGAADSSQGISNVDVEKGMMMKKMSWPLSSCNKKKKGRQLLNDDDDGNDNDEVEGKTLSSSSSIIDTPWFRRKDYITYAVIILIGIIVGCIAFLILYLTFIQHNKQGGEEGEGKIKNNLGLISSEFEESSEFVSPWNVPTNTNTGASSMTPEDSPIISSNDTDGGIGGTTTSSPTLSSPTVDDDVDVDVAVVITVPVLTRPTNNSNDTTVEDDSVSIALSSSITQPPAVTVSVPVMVEGNNTVATATRPPVVPVFSMTSSPSSVPQQVAVPVVVVVEEETATSTSSPSSTPVQQVAAPVPHQPVIVAATDITPSTTTIDNGTSNGGDNSDNNNSNNSRMIPVIKDTDTIQGIIKIIRRQIELLIFDDDTLIGSFLRLVFHDCVGGCDGCIDLTNPDNNGLDKAIDTLQPIVDEFTTNVTSSSSTSNSLLSRTDIWMLSSLVATEIALPFLNNDLLYPLHWIGRQTCEQKYSNNCGLDFLGNPTQCEPSLGPHIEQPHGNLGTKSIEDFFDEEFNFNPQQITAIMGAHSVGRMHRENSGFDGTWDLSAGTLDGGYWLELIGQPPDYFLESINNSDLPDIPDRKQWRGIINHETETDSIVTAAKQKEQKTIAMLNVDIALVKNVLDMDEQTGDVGCNSATGVNNQNLNDCSNETPFWSFANIYNGNNRKFLTDFRDVLNHLTDHGHSNIKPLGSKTICPIGRVCTFGFTHGDTTTAVDNVIVVEEVSPPPTPSPSRSPPRIIPSLTLNEEGIGPKIELDRLCYDTVGENLVVTYNLFLEEQGITATDITIQVFDINNIDIVVMLENEAQEEQDINPSRSPSFISVLRTNESPLISSLSCGSVQSCHTWTSRGGLQISTQNLIGDGNDYGVLLLANKSNTNTETTTTDDKNDNDNRLEILAGVSFRLGGCNE